MKMSPSNGNRLWLGLALATCVFAVDLNLPLADDAAVGQKNTCAITQVLQVMNELLTVLSSEIRDLKSQVQTSCKGKKGRRPAIPDEDEEEEEDDFLDIFGDKDEKETDASTSPSIDDDDDDDDDEEEETVEVDEEKEEDYEYEESDTKTPADDLIEGIAKWWETIVPFAPNPNDTTTTTSTTESPMPVFPDYDDVDDDDDDDDDDDGDGEGYRDYDKPDPWYGVPSTTPEPPLPFTVPPPPTSCPQPFRLQAGGCYLIFSDQRDWRSWGESHAFCQNYGGTLAAPWRLRELQEFLSRYYSDAFWIGASIDHGSRSWKWLSGRRVENSAWKRGQPNRNPGMKCVFLDKWSGYRANNFFCGEKYPFICDYREE